MTPATRPTVIGTMMRGTQASYRGHHPHARASSGGQDFAQGLTEATPSTRARARASSGGGGRCCICNTCVVAPSTRAREHRRETIRALWLACHTQQEIADAVGCSQKEISEDTREVYDLEALPKGIKLAALHEDGWGLATRKCDRTQVSIS